MYFFDFFIINIFFLLYGNNLIFLIFALQIFFIAFNILEIFLPSCLSQKIVINSYKGSVMSIYSTSQFLGIACGGIANGWLKTILSINNIFLLEIFIALAWFVFCVFDKK